MRHIIIDQAKAFAIHAHASIQQKRKYTEEPYHVHCERVVKILEAVTDDVDLLAAAWMHDVLEDVAPVNADYCEANMRILFNPHICRLVVELTDPPHQEGNRAIRKARDRERLSTISNEGKTIKLADVMDNFLDIQVNNPSFARTIASEVELLLPCLEGGNTTLFAELEKHITNYKKVASV